MLRAKKTMAIMLYATVISCAFGGLASADSLDKADLLEKQVSRLDEKGRYREAATLAQRALHLREKALGRRHPDTAGSLEILARLQASLGHYAKAETLFKQALDVREKELGPEHPLTAVSLSDLGMFYMPLEKYGKAEPLLKRALEIRVKNLAPEHPDTATSTDNLASLYKSLGDYGKAEPLHLEALRIREKVLGLEHPDTAKSFDKLGQLKVSLSYLGEPEEYFSPEGHEEAMAFYERAKQIREEAKAYYQRALQIREKVFGPEHPETATSLMTLADFHASAYLLPEWVDFQPHYERALRIREKALGPEHPKTAEALTRLAGVYFWRGRNTKARILYQRALRIREKALGPEHPDTAMTLRRLGELHRDLGSVEQMKLRSKDGFQPFKTYCSLGNYVKAEAFSKRALRMLEKTLGPEHSRTRVAVHELGWLYFQCGDYGKSEPFFLRSLQISERVHGPDHPDTKSSFKALAELYRDLGYYRPIPPWLDRSVQTKTNAHKGSLPKMALTARTLGPLDDLAAMYYSLGDCVKAEPLFERRLRFAEKGLGPDYQETIHSRNHLAMVHYCLGDYGKAEALLLKSLEFETALDFEPWNGAMCLNNLGVLYRSIGDHSRAEPLLERALRIYEGSFKKPESVDALTVRINLAVLYSALRDYGKAEELLKEALQTAQKVLGPDHLHKKVCLNNLAVLHLQQGRVEMAMKIFQETGAASGLGACHLARGEYGKAGEYFQRAHRSDTSRGEKNMVVGDLIGLAAAAEGLKDCRKAREYYGRAIEMLESQKAALGNDAWEGFLRERSGMFYRRDAYEGFMRVSLKATGRGHQTGSAVRSADRGTSVSPPGPRSPSRHRAPGTC